MSNRLIIPIALLIIFLSAPLMAQAQSAITTEDVVYYPGSEAVGYLAMPEGPGPYPSVILIHEWWGLNDQIRGEARKFAELGYVALAVDLYNGKSSTTVNGARELAGSVSRNIEGAFTNLSEAVDYLRSMRQKVDSDRLASVGWCFGGGWSYQMALNDLGVKASVIYYGRFNPDDDFEHMRAVILGNFGEEDRSIGVDSVKEFQANLKTASGDHEIYIYPHAGHGFANGESVVFNADAAAIAWQRTQAFLQKTLK